MIEKEMNTIDAFSILINIPGCHLILLPDSPRFTIVEATDAYLNVTYLKREEAIGQGVFETHTENPNNPGATGVKNLLASLNAVVKHKMPHKMDDQRYDVFNRQT